MTRPRALICFVVLSTLGCAGVPALSLGNTPDKVADAYLHAALQDPLDPAREYVSLRCIDRPVWNGSPVRVLGQPIDPKRLEVTEVVETGDTATVRYEIEGRAASENASSDVNIFGSKVKINLGSMDVGLDMSNELLMVKEAGWWRVSCLRPRG